MEDNNVVIIEENEIVKGKKANFHWGKFWAWTSIFLSVLIPVVGGGVAILAMSMTDEENVDEINIVSSIGLGIGAFFFILDVVLELINLL